MFSGMNGHDARRVRVFDALVGSLLDFRAPVEIVAMLVIMTVKISLLGDEPDEPRITP